MIKVLNKENEERAYYQICEGCNAELEFSFDDTYEGWMGARFVKCPVCGEEVMAEEIEGKQLNSGNIEFPKHFSKLKGTDIDNNEIEKWVRECLQAAEKEEEPYGYFFQVSSGNTRVILMACEDEYEIVVTKDYYETSVFR